MRYNIDSGVTTNTWNTTVNSIKVSTQPCGDNSIHFMVLCPSGHCQTCSTVAILLQVRAYLKPSKYRTNRRIHLSHTNISHVHAFHVYAYCTQVYSTRAFLIYLYILCASCLYFLHYMSILFIYMHIYICILYAQAFYISV